jgi:hypothetical protein
VHSTARILCRLCQHGCANLFTIFVTWRAKFRLTRRPENKSQITALPTDFIDLDNSDNIKASQRLIAFNSPQGRRYFFSLDS